MWPKNKWQNLNQDLMFKISSVPLTLTHLERIAHGYLKVTLDPLAQNKMIKNMELLDQWIDGGETIYGVNTGFGALSDKKISPDKMGLLQLNLIRSTCAGVGPLFSEPEVRAIMLLRASVLARGYSGVRPIIAKTLIDFLNKNLIPVIPQKGSVGASGDLAPLAHLALSLIGEGEVIYNSRRLSGHIALRKAKIKPLRLEGREGLALINGTQVMTAISALNVIKTGRLLQLFDIASALSLEAIQGSRKPFDADIHVLRPHKGQQIVAKNIWKLVQNSSIQKHHEFCGKVQDSYSFRCIPQVHGSSRDAAEFSKRIVETELNAVTDNPLFFTTQKKWLSGGNFHGQYLSQAMDFLSIALSTLVNISERRIEKLLDPRFSNLPPFLVKNSGISSGLMIAHVTVAALASENKVLSHPASTDTIPTSANKEDHVSMGVHAALKAKEIIENATSVIAIELLAASSGIEFLRPLKTSPHLEKVMSIIRKKVPPIHEDRVFTKDIEAIKQLFGEILNSLKGSVE